MSVAPTSLGKTVSRALGWFAVLIRLGIAQAAAAEIDYGKIGDPVHLVVGYQPYYSEAWSGLVIDGSELWKKYLPAGSIVDFRVGSRGSVIIDALRAGEESIGYIGDMPAIVGAARRELADLRIVANIGLGHDQCNVVFVRNDAPSFTDAGAAIAWLQGKAVAAPKGSCADRFGQAVFAKRHIVPQPYLDQSLDLIIRGFQSGTLDGAVLWEPTASRLVGEGIARRVASGNDFDEADGAFIDMRADLIRARPDIVREWLGAELEAELFLANPRNGPEIAALAKARTTGFDEAELRQALFGGYPANIGGSRTRLVLPFGLTAEALDLIRKDAEFLYSVHAIDAPKLADDAVLPELTAAVLRQRGLTAPVGRIVVPSTR